MRTLTHGRVQLALHELRDGPGRPLLLLHALGQSSPTSVPSEVSSWPGPILALDFTGHGASTVPAGGGYSPEVLMADADAVLTEVGEVTVVGHGLGGYVGLLLAGGRPPLVHGMVICDGAGLTGGGQTPPPPRVTVAESSERVAPDPLALAELSGDVRPHDYAVLFARMAVEGSSLDVPITVAALERPRWLLEVMAEAGVVRGTVAEGLERYAK